MHIFKSLLCITALVVVASTAPAFDFGVDVLEGINDDAQGECHTSLFQRMLLVILE